MPSSPGACALGLLKPASLDTDLQVRVREVLAHRALLVSAIAEIDRELRAAFELLAGDVPVAVAPAPQPIPERTALSTREPLAARDVRPARPAATTPAAVTPPPVAEASRVAPRLVRDGDTVLEVAWSPHRDAPSLIGDRDTRHP
ncbi:MAG: hypothetical protein AB7Q29_14980 [Vicinamibacterales bacterium]